ncbi:MAG: Holliday junction resolvase RecU [Bacilli bacterium]|nr:Holliday junction resolvase RecU [Bacilli bacterium]
MQYPNKIKKNYNKITNYGNRGMDLENIIEEANQYYRENDLAYIYKKPTPIGVVKVSYQNGARRITDAFYKTPSTLDFNGIYKGHYIEFDAKETTNKTSFPLANIHEHQLTHIKNVINHGGIAFLIIKINNEYYFLNGTDLLDFIKENIRKSIPYDYIINKGNKLQYNYTKGLDYIHIIDKLIGGTK